jgi:predicted site-specific integrase-resolvase
MLEPTKIDAAESQRMRQDSANLGVVFTDAQWARVIQAVERRLERQRLQYQKKLDQFHQQKLDELNSAANKVRDLIELARGYEEMHKQHLTPPTDKQA